MADTIGFGLIGLGTISRAHLEGFRQAAHVAEIVAVCDRKEDIAVACASSLGATPLTDYRSLLENPRIDAVDVMLPHNLHYPVVSEALNAGKHVLVEKPLALSSGECRALIDLARAKRVTLTVAENTPFVTAYQEVRRLLEEGAIGAVRAVRTLICGSEVERLQDTRLWKGRRDGSGGGTIIDAGVHSFYLLEWLCGTIEHLRAFASTLIKESQVEDHSVLHGRLHGGAYFTCEINFTAEIPWNERLEVYGELGSLIVDQLTVPPAVHYKGAEDYDGTRLSAVPFDPRGWKVRSVAAGVHDFALAVSGRRAPTVDPADGYRGVLVAEKAYASIQAGGMEIDL